MGALAIAAVASGCGLTYYGYNVGGPQTQNVAGHSRSWWAQQDGSNAVRVGVSAGSWVPGSPCFNTAQRDIFNGYFADAAAHGQNVLVLVGWCPDPGGNPNVQLPPDAATWKSAVNTVVQDAQTAGAHVIGIEVYNEPNNPKWWPVDNTLGAQGGADYYAQHAYEPLVGSWAQTQAPLITAGMNPRAAQNNPGCKIDQYTWCGGSFFQEVVDQLVRDGVHPDAAGLHLYGATAVTNDKTTLENQMKAEFNDLVSRTGKPIWVTEIGVQKENGINNQEVGDILVDMANWIQSPAVAAFQYDLNGGNADNVPYDIIDDSGGPKGGTIGAYCRLGYLDNKPAGFAPGC